MRLGVVCALAFAGCARDIPQLSIEQCSDEVGCFTFNLPRTAVTVGHTLVVRLTSDSPEAYTWEVEEGLGRFDVPGIFIAPEAPGLVHIIARSVRDPDFFARVAIEVVAELSAPEIEVVGRTKLSSGVAGYVARIKNNEGIDSVVWQVANGFFTTSPTAREVTLTAGSVGLVVLQALVTNRAGDAPPPGGLLLEVVPAANADFTIDTPRDVTAGKQRIDVWVKDPEPDFQYVWTITQNGVATELSARTPQVHFAAGDSGDVAVSCRAINSAGDAAATTVDATMPLVPQGVTLLAGRLGGQGTADGPAGINRVLNPRAPVEGPGGTIYFIDGSAIRSVDTSGEVRTIAGNAALPGHVDAVGADARFEEPLWLALIGDALYVVENEGAPAQYIRRVDLATAAVTTTYTNTVFNLPCSADNYGHIGDVTATSDALYALMGDSSYHEVIVKFAPSGPTQMAQSLFSGACEEYYDDVVGVGAAEARYEWLHSISSVGSDLYVFDYASDYYLKRVPTTGGNVTIVSTTTDRLDNLIMRGAMQPLQVSTTVDAVDVATGESTVLLPSQDLTIRDVTVAGNGDLLVAQRKGGNGGLGAVVQRVSNLTPGPPTFALLAGRIAEYAGHLMDEHPQVASDARLAARRLAFAVGPRDEVIIAHREGFETTFRIDGLTAQSPITTLVGPLNPGLIDDADGPFAFHPPVTPSAVGFDALGRLLFGELNTGRLRRINEDGWVESIASVPNPILAMAVDPAADQDIHFSTESDIYRLRDGELRPVMRGLYGFRDSSSTQRPRVGYVYGLARLGRYVYFVDQLNYALRVLDSENHSVRTLVNTNAQHDGQPSATPFCAFRIYDHAPCASSCFSSPSDLVVTRDGTAYVGDRSLIHRVDDPLGPSCAITTISGETQRGILYGADGYRMNFVQWMRQTRSGDFVIMDRDEPAVILVRTP